MPNGIGPRERLAADIANAALRNIDEQLAKNDRLPLLASARGVVFAVLMNVVLQSNPQQPPNPPSPI